MICDRCVNSVMGMASLFVSAKNGWWSKKSFGSLDYLCKVEKAGGCKAFGLILYSVGSAEQCRSWDVIFKTALTFSQSQDTSNPDNAQFSIKQRQINDCLSTLYKSTTAKPVHLAVAKKNNRLLLHLGGRTRFSYTSTACNEMWPWEV